MDAERNGQTAVPKGRGAPHGQYYIYTFGWLVVHKRSGDNAREGGNLSGRAITKSLQKRL
jgi:hypothetical protein